MDGGAGDKGDDTGDENISWAAANVRARCNGLVRLGLESPTRLGRWRVDKAAGAIEGVSITLMASLFQGTACFCHNLCSDCAEQRIGTKTVKTVKKYVCGPEH